MKKIDMSNVRVLFDYTDQPADLGYLISQYLGSKGYFSNTADFNEYYFGSLTEVRAVEYGTSYPFACDVTNFYRYFIPEKEIAFFKEEKPMSYRQFKDIDELEYHINAKIDNLVVIRSKQMKDSVSKLLYTGYKEDKIGNKKVYTVYFGALAFELDILFKYYEFYKEGMWHPFGLEEND